MKKCAGLPLSLLFLLLSAGAVFATPPKDLKVAWNWDSRTLKVYTAHWTQDVRKHFVEKVEVFVDGKRVEGKTYQRQGDKNGTASSFKLPDLHSGAIVPVRAACNRKGYREESLMVSRAVSEDFWDREPWNPDPWSREC